MADLKSRDSLLRAMLLLPFAALAVRFWFLCDDSYITFRFAKNLARGDGLVYNVGEYPPVEGYSNFGWLLVTAVMELLHLPVESLIPLLSFACGGFFVVYFDHVLKRSFRFSPLVAFLTTLALAVTPAFSVWTTSGLATMPFALLVFLLFDRLVLIDDDRDVWVPAALSVALILVRTEGVGWVGVIAALSVLARALDGADLRAHLRRLGLAMLPVAGAWALYSLWRFQYYGTLVPNTALVKVGMGPDRLLRGAKYVLLFWASCLTPALFLLGTPLAWRDRRGVAAAVGLMAIAFPVYGVVVGGDFMPMGRLLLPGLPFACLLFGYVLQALERRQPQLSWAVAAGAVVLTVLPSLDVHLVPESVRSTLHFRLSDKEFMSEVARWDNMNGNTEGFMQRGKALKLLARPGDAVVSGAVGAIGYYSDIRIFDQYGLVTKEVAYQPMAEGPLTESPGHDKKVDAEFFAKYEPRFLYARAVQGKLAAGRMKDTLETWNVRPWVMDRYVPDFVEVDIGEEDRTFLVMVRLAEDGEDPARMWDDFVRRRKELNAELRAQYADREDSADEDLDQL